MSNSVSYLEAVVIGLVQGVAELFPISSLGHAVLIPAFIGGSWATTLNMTSPNSPYLALVVALHVATALALLVFFWRDWVRIVKGFISSVKYRRIETPYERLVWLLIAGTIPVGLAGLVLDKLLREHLGKPLYAGAFLALNGVLLYTVESLRSSEKKKASAAAGGGRRGAGAPAEAAGSKITPEYDKHGRLLPESIASDVRLSRMSFKTGASLGAAQIMGLFPGFSRSGSSIALGLFKGLHHEDAARFAFLLATPVILAAGVYKMPELLKPENSAVVGPAIAGSLVAFAASLISVRFLTRYFETRTLTPFAVYCFVVGVGSVVYFA
ncbi:MAG TPA: undecaprenyl-diphosphate phosphatase [Actinocrinis sp.]|nr:undecaprenyl-diphosphate phosphatase [Actinocrinis sp.]